MAGGSKSESSWRKRGRGSEAKTSSKRMKEKMNDLSDRVSALEQENLQLRLQLKVGRETLDRDQQEKDLIVERLSELVANNGGEEETSSVLRSYAKKFSDYGSERSGSVMKHTDQLTRLLNPTQVTKMTMWALCQSDDFFRLGECSDLDDVGESIWSIITKMLQLTDEQQDKIKSHRNEAKRLSKDWRFTLRECEALNKAVVRKNQALAEEMKELNDVLTPTQLAKFLLWVNSDEELKDSLEKVVTGGSS